MPAAAPTAHAEDRSDLAAHEEDAIDALAELHSEHYRGATRPQRFIDAITDRLGRPWAVIALGFAIVLWTALTVAVTKGGVDSRYSGAWSRRSQ
jgi:uncharacterized membrane protein